MLDYTEGIYRMKTEIQHACYKVWWLFLSQNQIEWNALLIWIEFQFLKVGASPILPNTWIESLAGPIAYSSQVIFFKGVNKLLFTAEKLLLYMPAKSWNARSSSGLNYKTLILSHQNVNASAWWQQALQLHEFGLQSTQAFIFIRKVIDSGKLPLIKLHYFFSPVIWAQADYLIDDIEKGKALTASPLFSFPSKFYRSQQQRGE